MCNFVVIADTLFPPFKTSLNFDTWFIVETFLEMLYENQYRHNRFNAFQI